MDGGRVNRVAMATIVLLSGLAMGAGSGTAADLGGDCCADLEERIAELEATTARKGNRKVSLEIYGQVNQEVLWWDDGVESNVGVYTNDNSRTRFGFRGKAKINSDWEAGYRLEVGVRTANSKRFSQNDPRGELNPADVGFDMRDSYWYLKSKKLGTGSLGRQATATDAITEINQTQTADFSKYSDIEDTGLGLLLRSSLNGRTANPTPTSPPSTPGVTGLTWRRLIGDGGDQPGEGERRYDGVKYASPEFGGFSISGFWGQDDFWDAALRYKGEFAGFQIAAGLGYGEQSTGTDLQTVCANQLGSASNPPIDQKCHQFGGSVSVVHVDTGLFVNFGAGQKIDDLLDETVRFGGQGADDEQTFWSIQAGIEKKWWEVGKTTIYGEYYDYEGGANNKRSVTSAGNDGLFGASGFTNPGAVWSTGVQSYGFGVAQGFDKAALTLYLSYRHIEGDLLLRELDINNTTTGVADGAFANIGLEDLDVVTAGGIIKF